MTLGKAVKERGGIESSKFKVQTKSEQTNLPSQFRDSMVDALVLLFELWVLNFELAALGLPAAS